MTHNNITGDRIASKAGSKQYEDNYEKIAKEWIKHKGGLDCPIDSDNVIEFETWTKGRGICKASDAGWISIRWYKILKEKK